MGFYAQHVLPRFIDRACGAKTLRPLRTRVCAGLAGDVIEIGFGTGHNIAHYPDGVQRVTAVEPSDLAWQLAAERRAASPVQIERSGLDGQRLPFDDAAFDCALSTWTMCTIPDAVAALTELRRVLKPGARLHFLEHGLAPDVKVQRWQHRLEPVQKRLAGGCTFTRRIPAMIEAAGFTITDLDVFYAKGEPKFAGADSLGVATA
jgi:ubiquinone/menaquinone biosynthesis C-methylase UbiE